MLVKSNKTTAIEFNASTNKSLDLTYFQDVVFFFKNTLTSGLVNTVLTPG